MGRRDVDMPALVEVGEIWHTCSMTQVVFAMLILVSMLVPAIMPPAPEQAAGGIIRVVTVLANALPIPWTVGRAPTGTGLVASPEESAGTSGLFDDTGAAALVAQVNAARVESGVTALEIDPELVAIARRRAVEISMNFSHDGLADDCQGCGENIGMGGGRSVDSHFTGWWNSPSHHNNLLFAGYTRTGVARYVVNGVSYAVQIFK